MSERPKNGTSHLLAIQADSRIDRSIDKLSQVIEEMDELVQQPIGPGNVGKVRSRFVALDKRAQKLVNQLVMQTWVAARGG